jgi:hypothetical protein
LRRETTFPALSLRRMHATDVRATAVSAPMTLYAIGGVRELGKTIPTELDVHARKTQPKMKYQKINFAKSLHFRRQSDTILYS